MHHNALNQYQEKDFLESVIKKTVPALEQIVNAGLRLYEEENQHPTYKHDGSPLTLADSYINEKLIDFLYEEFSFPIIGEEKSVGVPIKDEPYWLLDPIDGTYSFLSGSEDFCSCLALIFNSYPILGIIYAPKKRTMHFAINTETCKMAWAWHFGDSEPALIQVNKADFKSDDFTFTYSSAVKEGSFLERFLTLSKPNGWQEVLNNSAIKFTSVAEGHADAYVRFRKLSHWDVAAGQAIVEAAGGQMISAITGKRIYYDFLGSLKTPPFIAFGKVENLPLDTLSLIGKLVP